MRQSVTGGLTDDGHGALLWATVPWSTCLSGDGEEVASN